MNKLTRYAVIYLTIGAAVSGAGSLIPETRAAMVAVVYFGVILLATVLPSLGDSGPPGPMAAYIVSSLFVIMFVGMIVHSGLRIVRYVWDRRKLFRIRCQQSDRPPKC